MEETIGKMGMYFFNFLQTKGLSKLSDFIEIFMYKLLKFFGFLHYNQDISKSASGRSELIWKEAQERGIMMDQLVIFGRYTDYYRAKINDKFFYFESLPIPLHFPQKDYVWIDDKFILSKKLEKKNIPVPKTKKVFSFWQARKHFEDFNKPVIVKPLSGSRGRHTTTNINDEKQLKIAFKLSKQITPFLVISEHLFGSVYRATVIDGKLVGFFRGDPPNVVGDGLRSIAELIDEKNIAHIGTTLSEIKISEDTLQFLQRQGHNLDTILKNGETMDLSAKTGRMYGGYTKEMLPNIHPKMHEIFERASRITEVPVLGFDLIIDDPTKDPDTQKWGIIECNSLPFIDLHYFAFEGTPINLAKNVWDLWEK